MLQKTLDSLLTVFYPQECEVCNKSVEEYSNGVVCKQCWKATKIFSGNETLCFKCGKFLNESSLNVQATCKDCLLYTSPSPRDKRQSRMPSSA